MHQTEVWPRLDEATGFTREQVRRIIFLCLLATLLGVSGLAAVALFLSPQSAASPALAVATPSPRIVYLPDPHRPLLTVVDVHLIGAHVVVSREEFVAAASTAKALVFDVSQLNSLDPGWLHSKLEQRRLIVGLNVPMRKLVKATGSTFMLPPEPLPGVNQARFDDGSGFIQDWGG